MPQFGTGDMWTAFDEADLFLITTNSTLRQDGRLVMGRGIARQARERFPGLDAALGAQIQTLCGNLGFYGLLISRRWPAARLGAFQVKRHWQQAADLSLIAQSVTALTWWARYHDDCRIHLNFPGIGNGGLARAAVLPLLAPLPDNITIWEYTALSAPPVPLPPSPRKTADEQTPGVVSGAAHLRPERAASPFLPGEWEGEHGFCFDSQRQSQVTLNSLGGPRVVEVQPCGVYP